MNKKMKREIKMKEIGKIMKKKKWKGRKKTEKENENLQAKDEL